MAPVRLKRFRCAPLADVSATLWCCLCCGVRVFLIYTCDVPARQTSSSHKRGAHWIAMQCGGKLMRFLLGAQQPNRLPPQEETASGVSGACQDVLEVRTRRTKRMHLETGCGIVGRLDRLGGVVSGSSWGSSRATVLSVWPPHWHARCARALVACVLSDVLPQEEMGNTRFRVALFALACLGLPNIRLALSHRGVKLSHCGPGPPHLSPGYRMLAPLQGQFGLSLSHLDSRISQFGVWVAPSRFQVTPI